MTKKMTKHGINDGSDSTIVKWDMSSKRYFDEVIFLGFKVSLRSFVLGHALLTIRRDDAT
jgi:hypothetical protein